MDSLFDLCDDTLLDKDTFHILYECAFGKRLLVSDDILQIIFKYASDNQNYLLFLKYHNKEKILERVDFYDQRENFINASIEFLWEFRNDVCWDMITIHRDELSFEFIDIFRNYFDWEAFTRIHADDMPFNFISRYSRYIKWDYISQRKDLSMDFINENKNYLDLFILLQENHERIPIEFVRENYELFLNSEIHAINDMGSRWSIYNRYSRVYYDEDFNDTPPEIFVNELLGIEDESSDEINTGEITPEEFNEIMAIHE
jgi:hypothetical protein